MAITRLSIIAMPDAAAQDKAVEAFSNFINVCQKDGQKYILSSKASKAEVLADKPGSSAWTIVAAVTFANQADMDYYHNEDPVYQKALSHATDNPTIALKVEL